MDLGFVCSLGQGSHLYQSDLYVAEDDFQLLILLLSPLECWAYRQVPTCLIHAVWASCLLGNNSVNGSPSIFLI